MSLGDFFPSEFRTAFAGDSLNPGAVLHLAMDFPQGQKEKFVVLVGTDDADVFLCVINTEVNLYIAERPALAACQVLVDAANHGFLRHDSHLACHDIHRVSRAKVIEEISADVSRRRGAVSHDVRTRMRAAITRSRLISNRHKAIIDVALA